MTIRTRTPFILLLSALTVATGLAATPQRAVVSGAHDAPLTATVPVDPRITVGTLPNGLRYYIRANEQPQESRRASARRQRRVGARRRRPARPGALRRAHGLQRHAALSQAGRRSRSCSRLGMRFGAHVNANTSFDETVYELQIPDRQSRGHRSVAAHSRRLGARRLVRAGRDRQGARRHPRRVAARARRRRADSRRAVAGPAQGFALRRAACRSASRRSSARSPTIA